MPKAGQVFDNPVTGERMIFVKTGPDTNGTLLEIEFFIKPGGGKGLSAHFHPYYDERFEILTGSAHYKIGNVESPAKAGDTFRLPRKTSHVHPWNVGNDTLQVRKITQLDRPQMQLLLASAAFFEALYALAQQGKVKEDGLPRNILQTIVMLQALEPSAYVAGIPVFIQRPLFWLAAAIGRALGYKAYYPAVSTTTVPY